MKKIFVKETNGGEFVLSLSNDETQGIVYSDNAVHEIYKKNPSELSPEELKEFDFNDCLKYGNGYELFEGEELGECMDCKTII